MIQKQDILCLSTIDWDFNWQGHQEIMKTFAECGNRVLYVENMGVRVPRFRDMPRLWKRIQNWRQGIRGIRKVGENLYVFSPIVLPFPYSRIASRINRWILLAQLRQWMRVMSFEQPIVWTFLPTQTVVDFIGRFKRKLVVYYCIADFEKLVASPKKVRRTEERLLRQCDVVFAQGEDLKKRCEAHHTPVHIFPFGVNADVFLKAEKTSQIPEEMAPLKRPILGYSGGLHRHVDYPLIRELALRHPEWSLVFVGPVQTDVSLIGDLGNVFLLGEKSHAELPHYIKQFDICLVPYCLSEYTRTVYPTKMNEYLILGKPVVSTDLPEIRNFNADFENVVKIGRNYEEFEQSILSLMDEKDGGQRNFRTEIALEHNWQKRIEAMSAILENKLGLKESVRERMWKESFLSLLRASQRHLFRWVLSVVIFGALVFYTPVLWWAAEPLRISDRPQKSEAIVVLGGGVGERGRPGTSTIERARYASELYRQGWAPVVIFSSGYVYSYQEAEDMKLIARSSGVPEEAIFLETRSSSTYENVRFVKEILDREGWRSVLLVSAPYHMRRVSWVFRKAAPNVTVHYLPVKKNSFFKKEIPVHLKQMQALIHEVVGVFYYWLKGYV
ncbi:MAG: ElyC/SanA/YdcF family protein [Candidatus Omnitrophota bacterium]